jgi:hypothetical protein
VKAAHQAPWPPGHHNQPAAGLARDVQELRPSPSTADGSPSEGPPVLQVRGGQVPLVAWPRALAWHGTGQLSAAGGEARPSDQVAGTGRCHCRRRYPSSRSPCEVRNVSLATRLPVPRHRKCLSTPRADPGHVLLLGIWYFGRATCVPTLVSYGGNLTVNLGECCGMPSTLHRPGQMMVVRTGYLATFTR